MSTSAQTVLSRAGGPGRHVDVVLDGHPIQGVPHR